MFGLSDLTSISADLPPLCTLRIEHHHPIQRYPDSNPLRGLGLFSHYLPASVSVLEVRRCAFGVYAESPVHTDFHSLKRQQSLEVQSVRARQSAKVKALGNRFYAGKVLR